MTNPPDPAFTVYSILNDNWEEANCPKPDILRPDEAKRYAVEDKSVIYIYSVNRTDAKRGLTNAFRDRTDTVSIDVVCVYTRHRYLALQREIERIMDLTTVRSSPTTRPNQSVYPDLDDDYTANPYDQLIPTGGSTEEDAARKWWRRIYDVQLRTYWEAR